MLSKLAAALSSIQNGYSGRCMQVLVPRTFLNYVVLTHLYEEGFIGGFQINRANPYKFDVILKYLNSNDEPGLRHFKIYSKPSQRIFMTVKDLRQNFSLHDFVLLQSSLTKDIEYMIPVSNLSAVPAIRTTGIITLKEAFYHHRGGEVLLSIF